MTKPLQTKKGFTIIEVLIVLAIAGLILLIVFLAVPALQRNSRNTQIRNDVAAVLGYISEYSSNNNGAIPGSICSDASGNVQMISATTGCSASATARVGNVSAGTTVTSGTAMPSGTQTITVLLNSRCSGNAFPSPAATTNRVVAAGFLVETATGTTTQCQQS